ncbi:MAG: permease-like cell division protein FtsX [Patescibacteria group bacterium]
MITVLTRIIQYGWKNFVRNGLLSTTTVAIVTLSLIVFLGLILFNVLIDQTVVAIQDKIDITVSFKNVTPEDEIFNVQRSLEGLPEVKAIEYVSRAEALENFKTRHIDNPNITQALQELNDNPLEASLNIKANKPEQYATIAEYFKNPALGQFVSHVSYAENQGVIDSLNAIAKNVNRGGFLVTVILVMVAGLVVFNTIRLAIYTNRDEISIMRAVGASNRFVRGPYVVEGIVVGFLSALLSIIIALPGLSSVAPYISQAVPEIDITRYFFQNLPLLLFYQLAAGILVSAISSFIAVRRYLHG